MVSTFTHSDKLDEAERGLLKYEYSTLNGFSLSCIQAHQLHTSLVEHLHDWCQVSQNERLGELTSQLTQSKDYPKEYETA